MLPALTRDPCILLPLPILGAMAVAAGIVNFGRWSDPFSFGGDTYWVLRHPNILTTLRDYGTFNVKRIGIAVLYYATGIPYVLKNMPHFAGFLRSTAIEAPPLTPLLTNPLTILLAGIGLYRLWWKPNLAGGGLAILRLTLIGHAFAVLLILMYVADTLRYRFDFAGFMTLAALVGYRSVCLTAAGFQEPLRRRLPIVAVGLCIIGILGSHYILLVHKVWCLGVPMQVRLALLPFAPFAHAAFEP